MKLIYKPAPDDSLRIELSNQTQMLAGEPVEVDEKIAAGLLRDHPSRFEAASETKKKIEKS